mgnify:CR=1 FL=1
MEEKLKQIFVGKKYDKFKKKVFSLPAFFFGAIYFAYRKMVFKAFLVAVILTLLDTLTKTYASGGMLILTWLCIHLSIGLYFPLWYKSFYTKSVRKIIEKNPNATEEDLTRIATTTLSEITHYTTITIAPDVQNHTIIDIKFVPYLNYIFELKHQKPA